MHKVSRETYNSRGMSNMQLNDGPHGAWAGACRTSSADLIDARRRGGSKVIRGIIARKEGEPGKERPTAWNGI